MDESSLQCKTSCLLTTRTSLEFQHLMTSDLVPIPFHRQSIILYRISQVRHLRTFVEGEGEPAILPYSGTHWLLKIKMDPVYSTKFSIDVQVETHFLRTHINAWSQSFYYFSSENPQNMAFNYILILFELQDWIRKKFFIIKICNIWETLTYMLSGFLKSISTRRTKSKSRHSTISARNRNAKVQYLTKLRFIRQKIYLRLPQQMLSVILLIVHQSI